MAKASDTLGSYRLVDLQIELRIDLDDWQRKAADRGACSKTIGSDGVAKASYKDIEVNANMRVYLNRTKPFCINSLQATYLNLCH